MKIKSVLILAGLVGLLLVGSANAATGLFGRDWWYGYFTNVDYYALNWAFVPFPAANYDGLGPNCDVQCTVTEASFVNTYQARLNDPNIIDSGRAAAEIDLMLGEQGPDFGGSILNGISYAKAHFQDWENLIDIYAQNLVPGYSVDWNDYVDFTNVDTTGMGSSAVQNPNGNDPEMEACQPSDQCVGDISFINVFDDPGFDYAVVFNEPGGNTFVIKHKCANLTGDLGPLAVPPSVINITKTSSNPAPMTVGTDMNYTINVAESSPIPLTNVTIDDTLPAEFKYLGSVAGDPAPTTVNGQNVTWTFQSPADDTDLAEIADGTLSLGVQVQAVGTGTAVNTATGTAINEFGTNLTVNPGSTSNTVAATASTPAFIGTNGDVHAGGCGTASGGSVEGTSGSGSFASYVVSASAAGGISNFGSDGSSGSTSLNLGQDGAYAAICEPDLYATAMNQSGSMPDTELTGNTPATPYDISAWSGVYYINGNAYLSSSSPITNKMTIIDSGGNVYITTPVALTSASAPAAQVPSVGIIAQNDIDVYAPVTRIDAYMFSDGTIDTCEAGTGSCSTATLIVNGFLMGQNILFNRLGPLDAPGSPLAEQVILNPQIYLNPPTFFDTKSVDGNQLNGLGELAPLF